MSKFYSIYCCDGDSWVTSYENEEESWDEIYDDYDDYEKEWRSYNGTIEESAQFSSPKEAISVAQKIAENFISDGFSVDFKILEIETDTIKTINSNGDLIHSENLVRVGNEVHSMVMNVKDAPRTELCEAIFESLGKIYEEHSFGTPEEEERAIMAKAIEKTLLGKGFNLNN